MMPNQEFTGTLDSLWDKGPPRLAHGAGLGHRRPPGNWTQPALGVARFGPLPQLGSYCRTKSPPCSVGGRITPRSCTRNRSLSRSFRGQSSVIAYSRGTTPRRRIRNAALFDFHVFGYLWRGGLIYHQDGPPTGRNLNSKLLACAQKCRHA